MNHSTPGFPVHHQLSELAQTHVHRVGDAIQPSYPLPSPSLPAFNLSQHQSLFPASVSLTVISKFRMCLLSRFSHVQLFVTLWMVAGQAPVSMGYSRQEYWSGLPCPPPGDLTDSGIEPESFKSPALAGKFFTSGTTWEAQIQDNTYQNPNTFLTKSASNYLTLRIF